MKELVYYETYQDELPNFDYSEIFLLEILGEGASGIVQKIYNKRWNKFFAIKKSISKNVLEEDEEDVFLQKIEDIRAMDSNYNKYFLKYYGHFEDLQDGTVLIQMEIGFASLANIIEAGKVFTCAELLYVLRKIVDIRTNWDNT